MRVWLGLLLIALFIPSFTGCQKTAVSPTGNSELQIKSVSATPSEVPAGNTSLIKCTVEGTTTGKLTYEWDATGAYGYLTPMDSICIFSSPSCHSGPATVTVKVSDGNGAFVTGSVNLN